MRSYLLVSISPDSQNAEVIRVADDADIPTEDSLGMTVVAAVLIPDDVTWCMNADLEQRRDEEYPPVMLVVPMRECDREHAPRPIGTTIN